MRTMKHHDKTVSRYGCRLHYSVTGEGPGVLFIQGVGVHGQGWQPQTEALADRFLCITFDNRGMGKSQPVGSPLTVETMADDALAILEDSGVSGSDQKVHVVGHSLGGLVAQFLAIRHPQKVRSLSLLCTFADGGKAAPLTPRMIWLGLRATVGTRGMRRKGFLSLLHPPGPIADPEKQAERLAPLFGHDLAEQPPIANPQLRAMRAANATPRLGELGAIPTLVVSSRHDPIAPPSLGKTLAGAIPGARYEEFADASHGLPITHADQVNRLLESHWDQAG